MVGWGLCVGSFKVDFCGNEDDGFYGLGVFFSF